MASSIALRPNSSAWRLFPSAEGYRGLADGEHRSLLHVVALLPGAATRRMLAGGDDVAPQRVETGEREVDRARSRTLVAPALEQLEPELVGLVEATDHRQHVDEVPGREGLLLATPPAPGEHDSRPGVLLGAGKVAGHADIGEVVLGRRLLAGEAASHAATAAISSKNMRASTARPAVASSIPFTFRPRASGCRQLVMLGQGEGLLGGFVRLLEMAREQQGAASLACKSRRGPWRGIDLSRATAIASRMRTMEISPWPSRSRASARGLVIRATSTIRPAPGVDRDGRLEMGYRPLLPAGPACHAARRLGETRLLDLVRAELGGLQVSGLGCFEGADRGGPLRRPGVGVAGLCPKLLRVRVVARRLVGVEEMGAYHLGDLGALVREGGAHVGRCPQVPRLALGPAQHVVGHRADERLGEGVLAALGRELVGADGEDLLCARASSKGRRGMRDRGRSPPRPPGGRSSCRARSTP